MLSMSGSAGMTSTAIKRALWVVLPIVALALLLMAPPASADYTHTYIEVTNGLDRTILAEVTQYDTYYGETEHQSKSLAPGQSHVFYFQPTAWFMWEATYEYRVQASQVDLLYVLHNRWDITGVEGAGATVTSFAKYTRNNSSYSAYVTFGNQLFLRGVASTKITILR